MFPFQESTWEQRHPGEAEEGEEAVAEGAEGPAAQWQAYPQAKGRLHSYITSTGEICQIKFVEMKWKLYVKNPTKKLLDRHLKITSMVKGIDKYHI